MPSLVKESQIKWTEYPIKKPKLAIGQKIDKISDKINAVVMLWIIPLCFTKNCNGLKIKYFPDSEVAVSKSGRNVAIKTAVININLDWTCCRKIKIIKVANARWVFNNIDLLGK